MKSSNLAAMALGAAICSLICGCGDTFRPVATPLPQASPVPQTARFATFTSCQVAAGGTDCSPTGALGASTDIDVSGDTVAGVTVVGVSPIIAIVESSLVVTADRDSDTVTSYSRIAGASAIPTISAATTTGLPSGSTPVSLINANGTIYVAESGRNVVGVMGGSPLSITAEVPVGNHPIALTVLPNAKKIYAVNQADNTVTVIDISDNSVVTTVTVGSSPVFAVPSADSSHVYVVNQGASSVSVIDATNDMVIATLQLPAGSAPNYAAFDVQNQRVVVTNPGSGTSAGSISVINADPTSPQFKTVTGPITVGINPRSVTALLDGSRLYVANAGSNSVSVINSLSLTVSKTIPVGTAPVSIASDQQSAKVFTANRDSFNVSIIKTSTDTELTDLSGNIVRIQAPPVIPGCDSTTTKCALLNPIFIGVGPG